LKDTNARQPRSERRDTTHKLTTDLTKTYRKIGIEDLNVRGTAANIVWMVASTSSAAS
jgi:transposase